MTIVRVALDVPLPTLFDYKLPGAGPEHIGRRVLVPFGRKTQVGVILEAGVAPAVDAARIRAVTRVFRDEPPLPPDVLELLEFASRYYHYPIGQVALSVLPQMLRRAQAAARAPDWFTLSAAGRALDPAALPIRATTRRRILTMLKEQECVAVGTLRASATSAPRVLADLVREGLVEPAAQPQPGAQEVSAVDSASRIADLVPLTPEQGSTAEAIVAALGGFCAFLLHGVTGSGKTEVYFHVIDEVLRRGQQALVLVPEINLTPQLTARFQLRFPDARLVQLHSNLAEGGRLRGWRAAESGSAQVVIGTRLALFTPLPRLGLIVVDEEHDASFKQQDGLRYSARDLALLRAKQRGIPVVLGSATPSLESYAHATQGRYRLLQLHSRVGATMPAIRLVDTRRKRLQQGLAPELIAAIEARLKCGEQSLIFINRRGFAPALVCPSCGWAAPCTRCSARLVLHLRDGRLRCHYCGHEEPIALACASCGNQALAPAGHGTQRVESVLEQALPGARLLRIDRDSTRRRLAFEQMQARVRAQEVDVLIGTQMLAKGHDFPRLTLVGIVNADSALFNADFRASERLFALLTQVAGRAGRADRPGEVLIQTDFPGHPLYDAVVRQDYPAFARTLLEERKAAGFPPFTYQALLRAEATRRDAVDAFLGRALEAARRLSFQVDVYDPVPPPVEKVAGMERAHLLLQSRSRAELQRFLDQWHPQLAGAQSRAVRWSLDIDPLDL